MVRADISRARRITGVEYMSDATRDLINSERRIEAAWWLADQDTPHASVEYVQVGTDEKGSLSWDEAVQIIRRTSGAMPRD